MSMSTADNNTLTKNLSTEKTWNDLLYANKKNVPDECVEFSLLIPEGCQILSLRVDEQKKLSMQVAIIKNCQKSVFEEQIFMLVHGYRDRIFNKKLVFRNDIKLSNGLSAYCLALAER